MFIAQGAALLILKYPGGEVSYDFSMVFVGDVLPELLPAPIVVMGAALLAWLFLKHTRLGIAIYAVGSDANAAASNRVDIRRDALLVLHHRRCISLGRPASSSPPIPAPATRSSARRCS